MNQPKTALAIVPAEVREDIIQLAALALELKPHFDFEAELAARSIGLVVWHSIKGEAEVQKEIEKERGLLRGGLLAEKAMRSMLPLAVQRIKNIIADPNVSVANAMEASKLVIAESGQGIKSRSGVVGGNQERFSITINLGDSPTDTTHNVVIDAEIIEHDSTEDVGY